MRSAPLRPRRESEHRDRFSLTGPMIPDPRDSLCRAPGPSEEVVELGARRHTTARSGPKGRQRTAGGGELNGGCEVSPLGERTRQRGREGVAGARGVHRLHWERCLMVRGMSGSQKIHSPGSLGDHDRTRPGLEQLRGGLPPQPGNLVLVRSQDVAQRHDSGIQGPRLSSACARVERPGSERRATPARRPPGPRRRPHRRAPRGPRRRRRRPRLSRATTRRPSPR